MKTTTSRQKIVSALRMLWRNSPERYVALKEGKYTCVKCGAKQSVAKGKEQKVLIHHKEGVLNWDVIIALIRQQLLCKPGKLECQCPECHKKEEKPKYQGFRFTDTRI